MTQTRLVDSSYDVLTIEEARCLKRGGCGGFIQCLLALPASGPERPQSRMTSLENAIAAGLEVYGYVLVGSALPGAQYVDMARQGVPDGIWDELGFVAVDIETPGVNVVQAVQAFERLRVYGKSAEILYTSYHAWTSLVSPPNSTLLARRGTKLWNAYWDGSPDFDYDSLPYGGWKNADVVIEQYSGGTMQCGQYVDRNVANKEWLESLKGDDDMGHTDAETLIHAELYRRQQAFNEGAAKLLAEAFRRIDGVPDADVTALQAQLDELTQRVEQAGAALVGDG